MNLCAPQTFVCIDIPDSAQETLIQEQGFDPRAAISRLLHKFLNTNFQWVSAEGAQFFLKRTGRKIGKSPESPRVRVAEFAAIVE